MKYNKRLIAIDGPAASGKGTLARKIAGKLDYAYMDTGLLYRAVAYKILKSNGNLEDSAAVIEAAAALAAEMNLSLDKTQLRGEAISEGASKVAAIAEVRKHLFGLQRNFALNPSPYKGAVLDGRDIGTIICPEACTKLYVTASLEIRAKRRLKELQLAGLNDTYDTVLRDMRDRDERDAARLTVPMKPALDAVILDTSDLSADEALVRALEIIEEKCGPQT